MMEKRNNKPTQRGAFIISLEHERYEDQEGKKYPQRVIHDYPLLVLTKVRDVITILSKYTDYLTYCNNDLLKVREELKDACFLIEITDYDKLQHEIICDHPSGSPGKDHFRKYYTKHYLHIHRKPHGIYKAHLFTDFIE